MKIRKAEPSDKKIITQIFKTEYSKPPYNEKWEKKELSKTIKNYFKNKIIYIIEKKETIGFLIEGTYTWWDGQRGMINEIIISKKFQGKGYGKQLIKHFEKQLKKRNVKKVNLMSVTKSKAFKIYKKLGYKEHNFLSMEKKL